VHRSRLLLQGQEFESRVEWAKSTGNGRVSAQGVAKHPPEIVVVAPDVTPMDDSSSTLASNAASAAASNDGSNIRVPDLYTKL
jgi:hypothetical protein